MAPVSTAERRDLLNRLNELARNDLTALWDTASQADDFVGAITDAYPQLVDTYSQLAGQLAASWFEQADPGSDYQAKVADPPDEAQIKTSTDWALNGEGDAGLTRLEGNLQRAVYNGARDTTLLNVAETGGSWLREAEPDACDFCLGLEGEYASDAAAGFEAHDHCQCMAVENRAAETSAAPQSVDSVETFTKKYPDIVFETKDFLVEYPKKEMVHIDPAEAAKWANALDVNLAKYPGAEQYLQKVSLSKKTDGMAIAQTESNDSGINTILVERSYVTMPEEFNRMYQDSIDKGFHYPAGPDNDIPRAVMTHEFGHVLDNMTEGNARARVEDTLEKLWRADYEAAGKYQDFGNWIGENLSGYSSRPANIIDDYRLLNPAEALAEAFQDVEMNGENATAPSKALHKILLEELGRQL